MDIRMLLNYLIAAFTIFVMIGFSMLIYGLYLIGKSMRESDEQRP